MADSLKRNKAAKRVHLVVYTGSHAQGQGHETTFAQLVSDRLDVPIENIEVVHGDTAKIPFAMGTYGSRSLAVGGSAISKAMDKMALLQPPRSDRRMGRHLT